MVHQGLGTAPTSAASSVAPHRQKKTIRQRVLNEARDHERRNPGTVPATFLRNPGTGTAIAQVEWRRELREEIRWSRRTIRGGDRRSYSSPDRRGHSGPDFVFPGVIDPTFDMVVAYTPHPRLRADLQVALAETTELANVLGAKLRVVTCDAAADLVQHVKPGGEIRLIGGGGTDMSVAIRACGALRPQPDLVVLFTDGETRWPSGLRSRQAVDNRHHQR